MLLLRNLVGPGEVDDDLEDEVAEELQKYGQVQRVLIFEVTESNFPPEEAVRIFVEFKTTDEAHKVTINRCLVQPAEDVCLGSDGIEWSVLWGTQRESRILRRS